MNCTVDVYGHLVKTSLSAYAIMFYKRQEAWLLLTTQYSVCRSAVWFLYIVQLSFCV